MTADQARRGAGRAIALLGSGDGPVEGASRDELLALLAKHDARLETLAATLREALAETRGIIAETAPVEGVPGTTFAEAVERLAARFERETGVAIERRLELDGGPALDREREVVLLRCMQEGLSNVRRHAGATRARLLVRVAAEGGALLELADDGRGPDTGAATSGAGFGLPGLRDRAAALGGRCELVAGGLGAAGDGATGDEPAGGGPGATLRIELPARTEAPR